MPSVLGKSSSLKDIDFIAGQTLLVDKPMSWTSFDVVNKIRFKLKYALGVKKIKVGHAGTLDPMATGLLIICTGKNTKKIVNYQDLGKTYQGQIKLGATTPSYDAESEEDEQFSIDHISPEMIEDQVPIFMGDQMQIPPMFSAIKVDGQRLYKLARRGVEKVLKPRPITIHDFKILKKEMPHIDFEVACSKGTYIRSLAHDFGKKLDSGGYLTQLRRTKIGDFHVDNAWSVDDFVAAIDDRV